MSESNIGLIEGKRPRRHFREWCLWVFILLVVATAVALRVSVITAPVRLLLAGTIILGAFTGLLYLLAYWAEHPQFFFPFVFFVLFLIVWAALGNKAPDVEKLRAGYGRRLGAFLGTRYVLGGETQSGVDCSGLARAALCEAMVKQGITQANSRLLGPMFWKFWWRDMTTRDLNGGKYGYTKVIGHAPKLAGFDTRKLKLGDMAVADGLHVLVYYGNGQWIEASPDEQRVVVNRATPASRRPWFNTPVTLVRWWILEPAEH